MQIFEIVLIFALTLIAAIPLGKLMSKVFEGSKNFFDFLAPLENFFFKISGINPDEQMNWKSFLKALMTINLIWFVYAFVVLMIQGSLPLNPDGNPSMSPDLAFNTAISFLVNCNLQHYSGETGATYFSQIFVLMFLQFVSAATGIAAFAGLLRGLKENSTDKLGNFYNYFVKTLTRILLPLCIVVAFVLALRGVPMTFDGKFSITTLEGIQQTISQGPVAAFMAIKHIGTNGGGFFGANGAHPLENPDPITNAILLFSQVVIPIACVFTTGYYLRRKKLAYVILSVMTIGMLCLLIPTVISETGGNPMISEMGISQPLGNMEGKEVRFGPVSSSYWSIVTTIISTGSVNSMHDSYMPLSGAMQMLGMMTNAFFGGVGVGMLNYFIFLIIAVFVSGLMIGRTPEFLGKKIEAREMKIATIVALLHPLLILSGTAIATYIISNFPELAWKIKPSGWLNNPGYHGFSEMLYEYTSSAANNGSGFEGLADNNFFWNFSTGIVLLLGRFIPIIGPLAIAGILGSKKRIPESSGSLNIENATFGVMTFAVIVIIAALAFFPALALGPFAELLSLK